MEQTLTHRQDDLKLKHERQADDAVLGNMLMEWVGLPDGKKTRLLMHMVSSWKAA